MEERACFAEPLPDNQPPIVRRVRQRRTENVNVEDVQGDVVWADEVDNRGPGGLVHEENQTRRRSGRAAERRDKQQELTMANVGRHPQAVVLNENGLFRRPVRIDGRRLDRCIRRRHIDDDADERNAYDGRHCARHPALPLPLHAETV